MVVADSTFADRSRRRRLFGEDGSRYLLQRAAFKIASTALNLGEHCISNRGSDFRCYALEVVAATTRDGPST